MSVVKRYVNPEEECVIEIESSHLQRIVKPLFDRHNEIVIILLLILFFVSMIFFQQHKHDIMMQYDGISGHLF